jgi:putative oxidoreductase
MNGLARFLGHPRVIGLCRIAIGLVFLAAALAKIGDASTFARQIHHFRLVPFGFENLLAITLPWIELVLALAILTGVQPRAGSMVATGLMGLFVVVVAAALARGLDIECGCFGTADASRVGVSKLIENVGLLALAVIGGQSSR